MDKLFSIAIDGPSGAGKSTLAKMVAAHYGFTYVDTGAIYRTVGVVCKKNGIDVKDEEAVKPLLPSLSIDIHYDATGLQRMTLNGEDVTDEIRLPEVSMLASNVSALPSVREYLLDMQRAFARKYSVIMDGRDIGTVVLPDADLKIYLTASAETRAERRMIELHEQGHDASFDEVVLAIQQRDYQDMHRAIAPLRRAEDAVIVDTSSLNLEQSYDKLCGIIDEAMEKKK